MSPAPIDVYLFHLKVVFLFKPKEKFLGLLAETAIGLGVEP